MILSSSLDKINTSRKLITPTEKDYDKVINLYETGLDARINSFPSLEEYKELVKNKEIYVYKKKGEIVASLILKDNKAHYLISHIIVSDKYRGLGIGTIMMFDALSNINKKVLLWVSEENENARRIYEKMDFEYTDKISQQLIGGKND